MRVLLLLSILLPLCACSESPQAPLRLGTLVWPGYEPLYLAREQGYLDQDQVQLVEYTDLADIRRALQAGLLDAAAVTLEALLRLHEAKPEFVVVLVLDVSEGGDVILGRPEISGLADLTGKRIGVEQTGSENYMLTRAIQLGGLDRSKLETVSMRLDNHARAYELGEIDAAVTFEPFASHMRQLGAIELFSTREIPNEILDVLLVHRSVLTERREQIVGVTQAWFRARDYMQQEPEQALDIMNARLRLEDGDLQAAFTGLSFPGRQEMRELLLGPSPGLLTSLKTARNAMVQSSFQGGESNLETLLPTDIPSMEDRE